MNYQNSSVYRILFLILLLCCFGIGTAAQAQTRTARTTSSKKGDSRNQSISGTAKGAQQEASALSQRTSLKKVGNKKVELVAGRKMTLKAVSKIAFAEQNDFVKKLNKKGNLGKAILKKAVITEEVEEREDTFVLYQRTSMVVVDPESLKAASPEYKSLMGDKKFKQVKVSALSKSEQLSLREFIKNIEKLDPKDPVRLAADVGEQAVLDAINSGKGEVVIEDKFEIPKEPIKVVNGMVQLPSIVGGSLNFRSVAPVKMPVMQMVEPSSSTGGSNQTKIGKPGAGVNASVANGSAATAAAKAKLLDDDLGAVPSSEQKGEHEFTLELLNGFTRGNSWLWERRWDFKVGFFRITYGAGYGIGVRVPVKVEGKVSPTESVVYAKRDERLSVVTELQVETLDADAAYYRRAGVPATKVFDGDELVLEFQVGYGYKFRAFGKDVVHKKYTAVRGLQFSQDTRPPFGKYCVECGVDIAIPPKITNTELDYRYLKGSLTAGFHINGTGTFSLEKTNVLDGKSQSNNTITFKDRTPVTDAYRLNRTRLQGNNTAAMQRFGLRLNDFKYHIDLELIPQLRFSITAGYKGFNRTFHSPWIRLRMFAIDLPDATLRTHDGTKRAYNWEGGRKRFIKWKKQTAENDGSSSKYRPTPSRVSSPKKVTPVKTLRAKK